MTNNLHLFRQYINQLELPAALDPNPALAVDYAQLLELYWQALEDRDRWRRKAQRLAWGLVGLAVLQAAVVALLVVAR